MKRSILLISCVTILLLSFDSHAWDIRTITDGSHDVGTYTSIATDSNDKVHISYRDSDGLALKYATNASGTWEYETIDSSANVGTDTSIAVDSNNKVHISYRNVTGGKLKYATNVSGKWVISTVDNNASDYSDIGIDSSGKVHISYYDENNHALKYATNASGVWETATIDSSGFVGGYTSIAIDSTGHLHISYYYYDYNSENSDLMYATDVSGSWVTSIIESEGNTGKYTSIAVDLNDKAHISYYDIDNSSLKYITNASGSWVNETIDDSASVGMYSSIGLDSNGKAHIGYYDVTNYYLKYATNASGSWVYETADSSYGNTGRDTSLAIDSNDKVHISYSKNLDVLMYTNNVSGGWSEKMLDEIEPDVGQYSSIAVDINNKIHVSYKAAYHLRYATNSSGKWVLSSIDEGGNKGTGSRLVIDSNGVDHITYYDAMANDLLYATNASGTWSISTIDGYMESSSSMAIDSGDKLHLSYRDNDVLVYATNETGSWDFTIVDNALSYSGGQTSIALDLDGNPHIAYYCRALTADPGYLKYATNSSGSWVTTTIDNVGNVGQHTSIAADSNGNVHIVYYDVTNGDLKYATDASGSWVLSTIDSTDDVGIYTSMLIDSSDILHVAYYDVTNGDLKYATNASGEWVTSVIDSTDDVGKYTSITKNSSEDIYISYYDVTNTALKYATNNECSYSIDPDEQSFGPDGGEGIITVTVADGCDWTAESNADWITVTSASYGSGNGVITYTVDANTATDMVTGTITVAGYIFTVTEEGNSCDYEISPQDNSFDSAGGTGTITVTAADGCDWTAESNADWITVTSASYGSGSGVITYTVDANTATEPVTGTITVAGYTFTVTEEGNSCSYEISPQDNSFDSTGGTGTITVTAGEGCSWTAQNDSVWITITSDDSGTGNGVITYTVSANTGTDERTGNITIGGEVHSVTQEAPETDKPDLKALAVNCPRSMKKGKRVIIKASIRNIGKVISPKSILSFYLSVNSDKSVEGDALIGTKSARTIAKGKSLSVKVKMKVTGSRGKYYIKTFCDSDNKISEADEENNISVSKRVKIN